MQFEDSTKDFNGEKIFCRHLKPRNGQDPKCLVFICHGFAEHIGRYEEVFQLLSNENMYVFGHDHVGHGKSSGYRVWVENYNVFCIPAKMHIEETAARFPGKKIVVYGHSMGGLISSKLLVNNPNLADGLILEGPFFGVPDYVPGWMVSLGSFLGNYPLTRLLPVVGVNSNFLSHDTDLARSLEQDPLVFHGKASTRFITSSVGAQKEVFANAQKLLLPMLIAHGSEDHLCPLSGAELFYKQVGSKDKVLKLYEGGFHVLHDEPYNGIKESFLNSVVEWINTHC